MKKFVKSLMIGAALLGCVNHFIARPNSAMTISDADIEKILKAKEIIRNMVNYPDTLVFHDLYTEVKGNTVTLKFTCKNAYGVSETHIKDIKVN